MFAQHRVAALETETPAHRICAGAKGFVIRRLWEPLVKSIQFAW